MIFIPKKIFNFYVIDYKQFSATYFFHLSCVFKCVHFILIVEGKIRKRHQWTDATLFTLQNYLVNSCVLTSQIYKNDLTIKYNIPKMKIRINPNLKTSLMICQISCITNIPKMNSNKAGKNFQVRPIAISNNKYVILQWFCYTKIRII